MESPSGVEVVDRSSAVLQLVESGNGAAFLTKYTDRQKAQKHYCNLSHISLLLEYFSIFNV
jgi:hypothetical protein